MTAGEGWIGVDLDGTLAYYSEWKGIEHIGEPIPAMLTRVKEWLAAGTEVRIMTARVSEAGAQPYTAAVHIEDWCQRHLGQTLVVTCAKDLNMIELWDDRCVQVEPNTGRRVDGK